MHTDLDPHSILALEMRLDVGIFIRQTVQVVAVLVIAGAQAKSLIAYVTGAMTSEPNLMRVKKLMSAPVEPLSHREDL